MNNCKKCGKEFDTSSITCECDDSYKKAVDAFPILDRLSADLVECKKALAVKDKALDFTIGKIIGGRCRDCYLFTKCPMPSAGCSIENVKDKLQNHFPTKTKERP